MKMKNDGVKEATIALKGMLGICGVRKTESVSLQKTTNYATDLTPNSSKKKKKSKKSKDNHQSRALFQLSKPSKSTAKSFASNQSRQKENHKIGRKTKNICKNDSGNFAWSAFQSPPDASTLPLPSFSNSSSFSEISTESEIQRPIKDGGESKLYVEIEQVTKSKADVPVQVFTSIEKTSEIPAKIIRGKAQDNDNSWTKVEREVSLKNSDELPIKSSGVNLASLTSSVSSHPYNKKYPPGSPSEVKSTPLISKQACQNIRDPIAMLMNGQSYGTTNPAITSRPHTNNLVVPGMQHHSHTANQIIIHVQVPSMLLPGRRMMIPASPGYFLSLVVPEGVHPGMVIPVTVPNSTLQYPQYIPNHSLSSGQMFTPSSSLSTPLIGIAQPMQLPSNSSYSHIDGINEQRYPQPQFGALQRQKPNNGPEPGSWAARVATPKVGLRKKGTGDI